MTDFVDMVSQFHGKYKHPIAGPMTEDALNFRFKLISEEFNELKEEVYVEKANSKPALTKELADLLYVTIGFAVQFGLPIKEVFEEVHRSNMTKTGDKREDGKVLKGVDYKAPDLNKFFKE